MDSKICLGISQVSIFEAGLTRKLSISHKWVGKRLAGEGGRSKRHALMTALRGDGEGKAQLQCKLKRAK